MELLLNGTGEQMTNDMGKGKVFSALLTLTFTSKPSVQESQLLETRAKVWNRKTSPCLRRTGLGST